LRRGYGSECGSALREVGVAARFGSRSFAFVFGPDSLPMKDFCRGWVWAGSSVAPLLLLLLLLCFCFCFCSPPCHSLTSHSIFIYPDPALQRQENARAPGCPTLPCSAPRCQTIGPRCCWPAGLLPLQNMRK
jgi:hypothetical protein